MTSNLQASLSSSSTVVLGNMGFVSYDKDPLALYELGRRLRERIPGRRFIVLYIGKIQERRDKKTAETAELLRQLEATHDGNDNLFFAQHIPDLMLPYAFRSLDYCVLWYRNGTQSGRMAHAQGVGTCVVGRRIEGIGETIDLAGFPSAVSMEDLTNKITELILNPQLRAEIESKSEGYKNSYGFESQAEKHLLLEEAVRAESTLPRLDQSAPDVTFVSPQLAIASCRGLREIVDRNFAFLNVGDDFDLHPIPKFYHKIDLQDGIPVPESKMREAIDWIEKHIHHRRVIIFCRYGRGRSASIAIAFLQSTGCEYYEAVRLVSRKREGTCPLPGLRETIETVLTRPYY